MRNLQLVVFALCEQACIITLKVRRISKNCFPQSSQTPMLAFVKRKQIFFPFLSVFMVIDVWPHINLPERDNSGINKLICGDLIEILN